MALATAALALGGCGGDDNVHAVPPPLTGAGAQATPSSAMIVAAQAGLDGTASPALPASGVLGATQIAAQQAALDGETTASADPADQKALDANTDKLYMSF